jgi:hypothetical protein
MVMQEINRYADSEFRYTDRSDAAAVDDIIRRERQRERAIREIEEMKRIRALAGNETARRQ